jgi:hypothetical protein
MPDKLQASETDVPFFVGHATGTQNYVCLPAGAGFAWSLFTPQATLFGDNGRQATTHYFSLNPEEPGIVRATWEDSRDTSTVWGRVKESSTDENFVASGAIPWLLVEIKGRRAGPTGGQHFVPTTVIQRLNTTGGSAPPTGCAAAVDVGARAFVPYTADYFFYRHRGREES